MKPIRFLALLVLLLVAGCLQSSPRPDLTLPRPFPLPGNESINPPSNAPAPIPSGSSCTKPVFSALFIDPGYLVYVGQVGTVHGSGQFTVERSYLAVKNETRQKIPIYAPTDMALTRGAFYKVPAPPGQYFGEPLPDYVVYFDAGCGVEIAFGHLKEVVPAIAEQFSEPKPDSRTQLLQPIRFKAGDLIGYFIPNAGVAAFDFMAYDSSVTNAFANPARHNYGYGSTLLHAVCPYDFYTDEQKEAYYRLMGGRTNISNKPCGPISRDFPGTISGLWFLDREIQSIYDYSQSGTYGSALPIVGDVDRVIIGTIGPRRTTFIYPSNPTYKDPAQVVDEHCYLLSPNTNPSQLDGFIFFRLVDNETLNVFYSEKGSCPEKFPSAGAATYYR